jgi:hypothetical protein
MQRDPLKPSPAWNVVASRRASRFAAPILMLLHPATGALPARGVVALTIAVLHPWLKAQLGVRLARPEKRTPGRGHATKDRRQRRSPAGYGQAFRLEQRLRSPGCIAYRQKPSILLPPHGQTWPGDLSRWIMLVVDTPGEASVLQSGRLVLRAGSDAALQPGWGNASAGRRCARLFHT